MAPQKYNTTQNTRFRSKALMVNGEIEIQLGPSTKFRIKTHFCMIVSFGTLLKSSNGLIKDQFPNQSKVIEFMNLTLVWPKNSDE